MRPLYSSAIALSLLAACGHGSGSDAGADAAVACGTSADCQLADAGGVCRSGACNAAVPCEDDVECGLGERCVSRVCQFTGCAKNSDCKSGQCDLQVFACAECATSADCPADRPACTSAGRCVACQQDSDCHPPGPAYCDASSGRCVGCTSDANCPDGLSCGPDFACHGALVGQACSTSPLILCDEGLLCVSVNNRNECLQECDVYTPQCPSGQICIELGTGNGSVAFENGQLVGACFAPISGLKGFGQPCTPAAQCEPDLACVPDSRTAASCHNFCDPENPACIPGQICHPFPADVFGHQYGICYADDGYWQRCGWDGDCRSGLSCTPGPDPSSLQGLSDFCSFDVGSSAAMSPCDGGATCASGYCVTDQPFGSTNASPDFCYGTCQSDSDCGDAGAGLCLQTFGFSTGSSTAVMNGCEPQCPSPSWCAAYGASLTCRMGIFSRAATPLLERACVPPDGPGGLGAPCSSGVDCREGYCQIEDGRGVFRDGFCTAPCQIPSDCPGAADGGADAGTLVLGCAPGVLIGSPGPDGIGGTRDDVDLPATFCNGGACADDSDCADGGTLCTVDVDPSQPLQALVLACRPPSLYGSLPAGASCVADSQCASGACASVGPPSTFTGKACFQPCVAGRTNCPAGLTCRQGAAALAAPDGTVRTFDSCAP